MSQPSTIHTSLSPNAPPLSLHVRPVAWIGRGLIAITAYLGGLAILAMTCCRAIVRPHGEVLDFATATFRNFDRILMMSVPTVAIVHVGLGSFLAMQAYFGATFVDGIGPVVGVGLVRNLGPLMSAFVLAGILSAYFTGELRGRERHRLLDEPEWLPDRGAVPQPRQKTEAPRLVATRVVASALAGPILGLWASIVGIVVGWGVGKSLLGVTTPGFFDMFIEMLWVRDVVGLVIKGMLFGAAAAFFPCFEGIRAHDDLELHDFTPAIRAAFLAGVTILFVNSAWFLLLYHAGPAFGPTVLTPPQQ